VADELDGTGHAIGLVGVASGWWQSTGAGAILPRSPVPARRLGPGRWGVKRP
jgi:hypothetical protein